MQCVSYCAWRVPVARRENHVEVPVPSLSCVAHRSLSAVTPTSNAKYAVVGNVRVILTRVPREHQARTVILYHGP